MTMLTETIQYTVRAWVAGDKLVSYYRSPDLAELVRVMNAAIEHAPLDWGSPVVRWEIEGKPP